MTNIRLTDLKRMCRRVVRWTAFASVAGAVGGIAFGGVFGASWFLADHDPIRILSIAGYFGVCGVLTGALIGMFGGITDDDQIFKPTRLPPRLAKPSSPPVSEIREPATTGQVRRRHPFGGLLDRRKGSETPFFAGSLVELTATCEQRRSVMQIALADYFVRAQCTFPNLECVARKKRNAASFR